MLYIIPTPVGNLDDFTIRAKRVLEQMDYVLAEDTRTSGQLLRHYEIKAPLRPFHIHNEHKALAGIIADLQSGMQIGLVSDAGTPGISDPGYLLVRECIKNNIALTCLPGATAFVPALVMSGFPTDAFYFAGFLPHKKGRQSRIAEIAQMHATVVIYESPHRLPRLLRELEEHLAAHRRIAVVREISKMHEEVHRGTAAELSEFFETNTSKVKGELVVVLDRQ